MINEVLTSNGQEKYLFLYLIFLPKILTSAMEQDKK